MGVPVRHRPPRGPAARPISNTFARDTLALTRRLRRAAQQCAARSAANTNDAAAALAGSIGDERFVLRFALGALGRARAVCRNRAAGAVDPHLPRPIRPGRSPACRCRATRALKPTASICARVPRKITRPNGSTSAPGCRSRSPPSSTSGARCATWRASRAGCCTRCSRGGAPRWSGSARRGRSTKSTPSRAPLAALPRRCNRASSPMFAPVTELVPGRGRRLQGLHRTGRPLGRLPQRKDPVSGAETSSL